MNPLGPPDPYLADVLMSTLVCSVAAVSALLLLGVIVYVAMVVELLRGNGHPNGRLLAFTGRPTVSSSSEVWVIENLRDELKVLVSPGKVP